VADNPMTYSEYINNLLETLRPDDDNRWIDIDIDGPNMVIYRENESDVLISKEWVFEHLEGK